MPRPLVQSHRAPALRAASLGMLVAACVARAHAQPLSGDYTIGSVASDFATIGQAVATLVADGVAGPVSMRLATGAYTEQLVITPIPGASASATVTFESATGAAEDVRWQFGPAGFSAILLLDAVDHLRFRNLSFDASLPPRTSQRNIIVQNGVDDIQFTGCSFRGTNVTVGGGSLLSCPSADAYDRLLLEGNTFTEFSWAIQLTCGGSQSGLVIRNNTIFDPEADNGIHVSNSDSVLIEGNFVTGSPALHTTNCANQVVRNNVVHADVIGLWVEGGGGPSTLAGLVANNMVHVGSSQTGGGLVVSGNATGLDVFHNTVRCSEPVLSGGAALLLDSMTALQGTCRILNNIFVHAGAGVACRMRGAPVNLLVDNNNLHTTGVNLANWGNVLYPDLAALQAGSGQHANSVSEPVQFEDPATDLHLAACSVGDSDLQGPGLPEVVVDIDGDPRSATSPALGADESYSTPPVLFLTRQAHALADAWHMDAGDLDGDGDVDLAVATGPSDGPGSVTICWNDGAGGFSVGSPMPVSSAWAWKVGVADLDDDGAADILVLTASGALSTWVIWSEGDGTFATPQLFSDIPCCKFDDLAIGDVDGDGDPDVVASYSASPLNGNQAGVWPWLNEGSRVFAASNSAFTTSTVEKPVWLLLRHMDTDGRLDVLLMDDHSVDEDLALHRNLGLDGDGEWLGFDPVGEREGIGSLVRFGADDMDGDADVDVVAFDDTGIPADAYTLRVWRNDAGSGFLAASQIETDKYRIPANFELLDYEQDGHTDIVTVNTTGDLSLYRNDGTGGFPRVVACDEAGPIPGSFVWYKELISDDFNGDQAEDMAILHSDAGEDSISIYLNAGWGVVAAPEVDRGAPGLQGPVVAQLSQNHPNPFNPATSIGYRVASTGGTAAEHVRLQIFNVRGERVRTLVDHWQSAGDHRVRWDGKDDAGRAVASGAYVYRLVVGHRHAQSRKMLLVR